MFNPWKRKVKRENKAAQILASVESNPQGDNLLKDIIKEYLPENNISTKNEGLESKEFGPNSIVKIESTLFDDVDDSIVNGNELNESTDSNTSITGIIDSNNKDIVNNNVDKRNVDDLSKINNGNSDHVSGKGLGQNSGNNTTKKGSMKSIVRDGKYNRIQKWTRSSEDSFEQELALAIKYSLKDSQSNDQFEETVEETTSNATTVEINGKIQLTYRTQCIDNYCHICEEMYLGHSLLDLPQITYKKMASFESVGKEEVVMSWNRIWNGYKLLCSKYRKPQIIDLWGPKEVVLFELALFRLGKEFYKIHQLIPTKSVREIVDFYYTWKKTRRYHLWKQVRHLTFEDLETEDICRDLFQRTCSSSGLENIETNVKDNVPDIVGSGIANSGNKRSRTDVKHKSKK